MGAPGGLDGETPLKDQLRLYVTKMRKFLTKPKTFSEIMEGVDKGNIYRKNADGPAPSVTLVKVLNMQMTWTRDKQHKLLLYLCRSLRIYEYTIHLYPRLQQQRQLDCRAFA